MVLDVIIAVTLVAKKKKWLGSGMKESFEVKKCSIYKSGWLLHRYTCI